jgi:hypothetical protein
MNITKTEIGLIKRMIDSYEKEIENSTLSDFNKREELEEINKLKEKIENDINERRYKRGL